MKRMLLEQLKEVAGQHDWTLLHVKDDVDDTVMIIMGEEAWVEEFFGDIYSESE